MDELSIWTLKTDDTAEAVKPVSEMDLEDRLEGMLVQRPEMLGSDIRLVGRQTHTDGGPSDLLGVNGEGRLVVFELKRGRVKRDAVTQCIDYASALDAMEPEKLAEHIAEHSGTIEQIDDKEFKEWYEKEFDGNELSNLLPPRLVLVGLGVDETAERMARFLQAGGRGINISVLTFYGFQYGNETLLARQVEIENESESLSSSRRSPSKTADERREALERRLLANGTIDLFETIRQAITTALPNANPDTGTYGVTLKLRRQKICRISVDDNKTPIKLDVRATEETYDTESLAKMAKRAEAIGWHPLKSRDGFWFTIMDTDHWEQQRQVIIDFLKEAAALRRKEPATDES